MSGRRVLALVTAALALAGCFGNDAPQGTPSSSTPTVTSTAVVVPAEPAQMAATPVALGGSVRLPARLPRIHGDVESAARAQDGSVAVVWVVTAPASEVMDAIADAITVAGFTLELDDRAASGSGGVLAFDGPSLNEERIAGHYLVTSSATDTRVELRLDPPRPVATSEPRAVPLPSGYPSDDVPIYHGATVVSARASERSDGGTRFLVTFETPRQPVEVLGFYRDLLFVAGWELVARPTDLDGAGPGGSISLTVVAGPRTRAVLLLETIAGP